MIRAREDGMVSIIVVMFTALLLIIISVGFLRIMSQEATNASDSNLSQSAYDSAVSGVEDAKRVITACNNGSTQACDAIANQRCDTVQAAGILASTSDTKVTIRSNGMEQGIQGQAYTCVVVTSKTDDVKYTLEEGVSEVFPLTSTANSRYVRVQWTLKSEDVSTIQAPSDINATHLPQKSTWGTNVPAVLRVQVVAPQGGSFSQDDFDGNQVMTAFLRPIAVTSVPSNNVVNLQTVRAAASENNTTVSPHAITCSLTEFNANQYACTAYLDLGEHRAIQAGSRLAYMRVTSLYNRTQLRASFQDTTGATVAQFDGVQPIVDSTGRASDVYRRVSSRVSPDSNFNFPEFAVDVTGNLCKDFSVTDSSVVPGPCSTKPAN